MRQWSAIAAGASSVGALGPGGIRKTRRGCVNATCRRPWGRSVRDPSNDRIDGVDVAETIARSLDELGIAAESEQGRAIARSIRDQVDTPADVARLLLDVRSYLGGELAAQRGFTVQDPDAPAGVVRFRRVDNEDA